MTAEDKQALGQTAYDKALKYELDYGCCPQCVLAAVQETVGVIRAGWPNTCWCWA